MVSQLPATLTFRLKARGSRPQAQRGLRNSPPSSAVPKALGLCTITAALHAITVALGIVLAMGSGIALAQSEPLELESENSLGDDIIIEGLGFSKLILQLKVDGNLRKHRRFRRLRKLIEKNLCWSGLFNLADANDKYCRIRGTPPRKDMRLDISADGDRVRLRLRDTGPEDLVLFEDALPLVKYTPERAVMDLVNRLTERITGQPGLLGTTIAYVLRQPGRAKVIVGTTTHGVQIQLLSNNSDINLLPRWSPDGNILVYTILNRRGTRVYLQHMLQNMSGEDVFLHGLGSLNSGGTFSPDGTRVALTMSDNKSADLFQFDMNTKRQSQLTFRSGIETQADWSPDGKNIVFVSDRAGTPQIYLLDLETGEDLRVTFDSNYNADPRWSPDGKRILFTKRFAGRDQIYIMDKYGSNVRPVTRSRYDAEQPEWSPDGHQIVFPSNRTGEYKLYVVSSDGSNLRRLTRTPKGFEESSPAWTRRRWVE